MKTLCVLSVISFLVLINSVNAQTGWYQQESGTSLRLNEVFFLNAQTGWCAGDSGKILKTTNSGVNWISQNSNTLFELRSVFFLNKDTGFAAGGRAYDGIVLFSNLLVLKTVNGGTTWLTSYNSPDNYNTLSKISFLNANTGVATGFGGTGFVSTGVNLRTTNGGFNWFFKYSDTQNTAIQFTEDSKSWISGNYLDDVGRDSACIYNSTDNGFTFNKVYTKTKYSIKDFHFIDRLHGYFLCANMTSFPYSVSFFETKDGGVNWLTVNTGLPGIFNSVYFSSGQRGWIAGRKILVTYSAADTWEQQYDNGNSELRSITFTDSLTGWAVGDNGKILNTITGGLTSIDSESSEITGYNLNQNYPNPFNPRTIINYELGITNFVNLIVYDVLGNEVTTLVNERQSAGSYEVEFDGSSFASGIYFYKLETDDFSEVRKMTLVK